MTKSRGINKPKRIRPELYAAVLSCCWGKPLGSYAIKLKSNINTKTWANLCEELVSRNYLYKSVHDGKVVYGTTKEGLRFLHEFKKEY